MKDLDEPASGEPFDKNATITSKEGTTWDIPVFWIGGDGKTADVPEEGKSYMPLLVFFVPDGYTSDGILALPSFLSNLFLSVGGILTIVDYEHGITYITGNAAELPAFKDDCGAERFGNGKDAIEGAASDHRDLRDSSAISGESEERVYPDNPGNGEETKQPKDPDDEQPGDEPEKPDDGQPGDEPEEPDPYVAFAEKYRNDKYEDIAWALELEALGGMENVDFVRLIRECGYNITSGIPYDALDAFEDPELSYELVTALSNARQTVKKEILEQADPFLKAHVDETIILESDQESLLAFAHMLIENIIPQTVLVLRERFPAFATAPDEAFSKDLGLEIVSGTYALAMAVASYEQTNDYKLLLQVCPEVIPDRDKKGAITYDFNNNSPTLNRLKDTLLHEMMHIFMYDYNRNGINSFYSMAKTENNTYIVPGFGELTYDQLSDLNQNLLYPDWFIEGIACLGGSVLWSHNSILSDIVQSADGAPLSAAGLYNFIQKNDITLDETDFDYDSLSTLYNDYFFGSLAVLYMGEMLVRKTAGESAVHLDENGEKTIDTMSIRDGISDILERMHNGETMDSVFADISDGRYKDTREFCEKCLRPEGAGEDVLAFMADVLNYVDALNNETGSPVYASILGPFTENILDSIDETKSAKTDIYVISDEMGYTKSTASEEITTKTGGKSDPSHTLSNYKKEEASGKITSPGKNALFTENAISEVNGQPEASEQTDDMAGKEVSEPACREDAEDLGTENEKDSCESETDERKEPSEFGAGETEEACEADAGEAEESCEAGAGEAENACEADAA